jgi:23S rRNA (uracil1939-C5)-methyltransferase
MTRRPAETKPAAAPLQVGQCITVTIQGMGSHGEGICQWKGNEIFVPKSAPGDQVEVRILEKKKGRFRASIERLIEGGSSRITPRCRHFEECGGCDFQHISYQDQWAWKMRMTKHWIRRSPLAPWLERLEFDEIPAVQDYHYRHRVRMQVKAGKLHFFKPHSHQLLELSECPILVKGFFESLQQEAAGLQERKDWASSALTGYEVGAHSIRFKPHLFSQGNQEMNQKMIARVLADRSLTDGSTALDLYCGFGNFSIPMRDLVERVVGVEIEGEAIECARMNSQQVEWRAQAVEAAVQDLVNQREFFSWVVLDPPRAGAWETLPSLAQLKPHVMTYVSCSLETLIRDLTYLTKKAGYRIERWSVVDLFPQTHHIESIVTLVSQ